jgi:hypothetical protein
VCGCAADYTEDKLPVSITPKRKEKKNRLIDKCYLKIRKRMDERDMYEIGRGNWQREGVREIIQNQSRTRLVQSVRDGYE